MKILMVILFFASLLSCSSDKQSENKIETQNVTIEQKAIEQESSVEFIKYPTVVQMLNESYDFTEKEGSLKVLSKKGEPLHIQVSKPMIEGDLDEVVKEQTMRDIVYVAFQAFAQTDVNELTISSVPMKSNGEYVDKYKLTSKVSRAEALSILRKYLNTEDFQTLFKLEGTIWVPSENFSVLKFKNLNAVFTDLKS